MLTASHFEEAERFLHAQIPLTLAMGVRVVPDAGGFAIEAPVFRNRNHLQTAFGGSINAVATLAGYAHLWFQLRDREPAVHVVVRESSIKFLQPIRRQIRAVVSSPDSQESAAFEATLNAQGKARITLRVRVEEDRTIAAEFVGAFVALRDERLRSDSVGEG